MREILTKIRSVSLCASSPNKAAVPRPSNSKNLASYPSIRKVSSSLSLVINAPLTHRHRYVPWNLFLRKRKKEKGKQKKEEEEETKPSSPLPSPRDNRGKR